MTLAPASQSSGIITWSLAGLEFRLTAKDEKILNEAARIFNNWAPATAEFSGDKPDLSITIQQADRGYEIRADGSAEAYLRPDASSAVQVAEALVIGGILSQSAFITTVHGALLARNGRSILIAGPSYSGKSTLACALWGSGFSLLCDDITMLECSRATAAPVPRRVSVRHPSRAFLGEDFWDKMLTSKTCFAAEEGYLFHPAETDSHWSPEELPLSAIVFLNRLGAPEVAPAALNSLIPAKALLSLAPYTNVIREQGLGDAIKRLEPLINQVPSFDMARGELSQMVTQLTHLVDEAHV